MKETLKNSDIDSIIPCGGGIETAAAVAWAVGQGYKPFLFTEILDRNSPAQKGMTKASEYIAKYFDLQFFTAYNDIPMENQNVPPTDYASINFVKVILGNPSLRIKNIVCGGNAEDSMQQRIQLRYIQKIIAARWSNQYDMHGLEWKHFLTIPHVLWPLEYLTKSEIIGIMIRKHPDLVKNTWTCIRPVKEENNYKQCGQCPKCNEWSSALRQAKNSSLKVMEGRNYEFDLRK